MAHTPPRALPPAAPRPLDPISSSGLRVRAERRPPEPTVLGRYRVVEEIGSGGMASVHLARVDGPGGFQRWVAIKRVHPHLVNDEQFVDMFLDEARTAAGISHANVALVFDVGRDDDTYWLAMEYLHGESLREIVLRAEERRVRMAPELAARICADAASGLHAAHELRGKDGRPLGLVHRDVSPHNLFVTYDGRVKVVDFGIAKVSDRLSAETVAGTLKGKLAYMSPEQIGNRAIDRRTDVFALGVVLWELSTGRRLFKGENDLETLERVQACAVPPPSTVVPGYPRELEACVMGALAPDRDRRFATARDFARALEVALSRAGKVVGADEVAAFVRAMAGDRIREREERLAWLAEVTRPAGEVERGGAVVPDGDDDDDLPTTVVSREALAAAWAPASADLGATLALPLESGAVPSPAFGQHRPAPLAAPTVGFPRAPAPPAPPPAPPAPAPWATPAMVQAARAEGRRRTALVLAALAALLLAALGVAAAVLMRR